MASEQRNLSALPLQALADRVREDVGRARYYQDGRASSFKEDALAALDQLVERSEKLAHALKDVLDAAERDRAGFAIESEEWYARRDYARIQLEDSGV